VIAGRSASERVTHADHDDMLVEVAVELEQVGADVVVTAIFQPAEMLLARYG
jgi:hypothetical protein